MASRSRDFRDRSRFLLPDRSRPPDAGNFFCWPDLAGLDRRSLPATFRERLDDRGRSRYIVINDLGKWFSKLLAIDFIMGNGCKQMRDKRLPYLVCRAALLCALAADFGPCLGLRFGAADFVGAAELGYAEHSDHAEVTIGGC